jgi:hypothetical protein
MGSGPAAGQSTYNHLVKECSHQLEAFGQRACRQGWRRSDHAGTRLTGQNRGLAFKRTKKRAHAFKNRRGNKTCYIYIYIDIYIIIYIYIYIIYCNI